MAAIDLAAVDLEAEQRAALQLTPALRAADGDHAARVLVHVAVDVGDEAAGRGDLGDQLVARLGLQPVRRVMRHQQGEVAFLDPRRAVAAAGRVQLADVERQLAGVVAVAELQEGAVEADDAELEPVLGQHRRAVAGQHAALQLQAGERVVLQPLAVRRERLVDEGAVGRAGVAPELDLYFGIGVPAAEHQRLGPARVGADEVMVAGDGHQRRGRAEGAEVIPQLLQGLVEARELGGAAPLGQVAAEQDQVPGAAAGVQLLEVGQQDLAYARPQPSLGVEALVEVREVKPAEGAHGSGAARPTGRREPIRVYHRGPAALPRRRGFRPQGKTIVRRPAEASPGTRHYAGGGAPASRARARRGAPPRGRLRRH
ncbi:hypothetical protein OV079_48645 [Nannocystis pusilla]|uniref:Uncharacterized protein n=1 Tax=Nannocystis pusilla TaxID=889268 RepID=A0A9X3J3W8_9BACT|nr:hypothetical protein [Nannocystis pusilla]MCY1013274.1 hypothetical protein [Nannocystis pusilla]